MSQTLFSCPLCASPLTAGAQAYTCPKGHSFDRAKEGYVHLLPANKKHSANPGDDKKMSVARNQFLAKGYYSHLRDALTQLSVTHTQGLSNPAILDAGCGEGYYDVGIYQGLMNAGITPRLAGVDLSKPSVRLAAKACPQGEFSVASVYHLPVADQSIDVLVNCFSPLAIEEFLRVLRPNGIFLYVTPAANHLWEMKEVLYDSPYPNKEEAIPYEGFEYLEIYPTEDCPTIQPSETIMSLFGMTPYAWKTPREGVERLAALESLAITTAFRIHVFRKI